MTDDTTKKTVTFSVNAETHSGNSVIAEESQKPLFQTQEEEEEGADDASVAEENKLQTFLTQAEDYFDVFKDPERRGSINIPHIVITAVDNDGTEQLQAGHFFEKDETIWIGSGLNNKPCKVALDKERNGKRMHNFSFSSRAIQATCVTGEEMEKLKIKSSNKFNLTLWSKHRNEHRMVAPEEEIDIGDED